MNSDNAYLQVLISNSNNSNSSNRETSNSGDDLLTSYCDSSSGNGMNRAVVSSTQNFNEYLRSTQEIPAKYQNVFGQFEHFNVVQSKVFDTCFHTDDNLVVSAPTGSGKTAIFELAIVRLLKNYDLSFGSFKIVYVAPMKALCEERLVDWYTKFSNFGVSCISVTGDTDNVDFKSLINHNLIITTPEKWDSLTRRWKDNKKLVELVKLFMIDEVHLLNEEARGSTLEAVITRMKIIQEGVDVPHKIRFIALSATFPNIQDIAEWLADPTEKYAKCFKFSEELRPVELNKVVLGYSYNQNHSSPFKFDLSLNYKLQGVLFKYANGRPTLIFCSTRKSVEMTAMHIKQNITIGLNEQQKQVLFDAAKTVSDSKVQDLLVYGVACHHAGMLPENRRTVEDLFRNGDLPILVTTSTLAMGVNLPAHLVIVKTTKCYINGAYENYSESQILQMIGRAGRPNFDTSATAVIMTTSLDKQKFENMVGGKQPVESNLHRHLTEHLNSEVVLHTITDLGVAMQWLTSTFLYIRARKHPKHYGIPVNLTSEQVDKKLLEMCQIQINGLARYGMLRMDENISISPTFVGLLMAKYYVAFETMKLFTQVKGTEMLPQMLDVISKCQEFSEIYLRVNDKKTLNVLNKCKNKTTIRYPLNGRIKTVSMKINCMIQAAFGNLPIREHSLMNESQKIMRSGERIVKCLVEYLGSDDFFQSHPQCFSALLSAVTLAKCFHTSLWENSPYVSRQLPGIGVALSSLLVSSGKTSFQAILDANPRDIERILNRKSPLGDTIQSKVKHLPNYKVTMELLRTDGDISVKLVVTLTNALDLMDDSTIGLNSLMCLLVGDSLNNVIVYERYSHSYMLESGDVTKIFVPKTSKKHTICAHFVSETWVGFDCETELNLFVENEQKSAAAGMQRKKIEKKAKETVTKAVKRDSHVQTFLNEYMKEIKNIPLKSRTSSKNTSGVNRVERWKAKQSVRPDDDLIVEFQKLSQEESIESSKENISPEEIKVDYETARKKQPHKPASLGKEKFIRKSSFSQTENGNCGIKSKGENSNMLSRKTSFTQTENTNKHVNESEFEDDGEWLAEIDKLLESSAASSIKNSPQRLNITKEVSEKQNAISAFVPGQNSICGDYLKDQPSTSFVQQDNQKCNIDVSSSGYGTNNCWSPKTNYTHLKDRSDGTSKRSNSGMQSFQFRNKNVSSTVTKRAEIDNLSENSVASSQKLNIIKEIPEKQNVFRLTQATAVSAFRPVATKGTSSIYGGYLKEQPSTSFSQQNYEKQNVSSSFGTNSSWKPKMNYAHLKDGNGGTSRRSNSAMQDFQFRNRNDSSSGGTHRAMAFEDLLLSDEPTKPPITNIRDFELKPKKLKHSSADFDKTKRGMFEINSGTNKKMKFEDSFEEQYLDDVNSFFDHSNYNEKPGTKNITWGSPLVTSHYFSPCQRSNDSFFEVPEKDNVEPIRSKCPEMSQEKPPIFPTPKTKTVKKGCRSFALADRDYEQPSRDSVKDFEDICAESFLDNLGLNNSLHNSSFGSDVSKFNSHLEKSIIEDACAYYSKLHSQSKVVEKKEKISPIEKRAVVENNSSSFNDIEPQVSEIKEHSRPQQTQVMEAAPYGYGYSSFNDPFNNNSRLLDRESHTQPCLPRYAHENNPYYESFMEAKRREFEAYLRNQYDTHRRDIVPVTPFENYRSQPENMLYERSVDPFVLQDYFYNQNASFPVPEVNSSPFLPPTSIRGLWRPNYGYDDIPVCYPSRNQPAERDFYMRNLNFYPENLRQRVADDRYNNLTLNGGFQHDSMYGEYPRNSTSPK